MSRRIVVLIQCGLCKAEGFEGGEVAFVQIKLSMDGKELLLDACEDCLNNSALSDVLTATYPAVKATKAAPMVSPKTDASSFVATNKYTSNVPGKEMVCGESTVGGSCEYVSRSAQGMGIHKRHSHGIQGMSKSSKNRTAEA